MNRNLENYLLLAKRAIGFTDPYKTDDFREYIPGFLAAFECETQLTNADKEDSRYKEISKKFSALTTLMLQKLDSKEKRYGKNNEYALEMLKKLDEVKKLSLEQLELEMKRTDQVAKQKLAESWANKTEFEIEYLKSQGIVEVKPKIDPTKPQQAKEFKEPRNKIGKRVLRILAAAALLSLGGCNLVNSNEQPLSTDDKNNTLEVIDNNEQVITDEQLKDAMLGDLITINSIVKPKNVVVMDIDADDLFNFYLLANHTHFDKNVGDLQRWQVGEKITELDNDFKQVLSSVSVANFRLAAGGHDIIDLSKYFMGGSEVDSEYIVEKDTRAYAEKLMTFQKDFAKAVVEKDELRLSELNDLLRQFVNVNLNANGLPTEAKALTASVAFATIQYANENNVKTVMTVDEYLNKFDLKAEDCVGPADLLDRVYTSNLNELAEVMQARVLGGYIAFEDALGLASGTMTFEELENSLKEELAKVDFEANKIEVFFTEEEAENNKHISSEQDLVELEKETGADYALDEDGVPYTVTQPVEEEKVEVTETVIETTPTPEIEKEPTVEFIPDENVDKNDDNTYTDNSESTPEVGDTVNGMTPGAETGNKVEINNQEDADDFEKGKDIVDMTGGAQIGDVVSETTTPENKEETPTVEFEGGSWMDDQIYEKDSVQVHSEDNDYINFLIEDTEELGEVLDSSEPSKGL